MRKEATRKKTEGKRPASRAVTLPPLLDAEAKTGAEAAEAMRGSEAISRPGEMSASEPEPRVGRTTGDAAAVTPETPVKRTKSEAAKEAWRKVRAGERPHPHKGPKPSRGAMNPLFDLSEEQRGKLFAWLRECPYDDAVQHMLRDQGIAEATPAQLNDFFQFEAEQHWEKRIGRAAQEANAMVQLVERSPVRFSSGILAALGQEAFRQIASGQVEPDAMGKLATLFLKARSDERADQMQELKREKLRRDLQGQIDHALEKLAEEVDRHPVAREAFEALRQELATSLEEGL
jgi:hypothetical protein